MGLEERPHERAIPEVPRRAFLKAGFWRSASWSCSRSPPSPGSRCVREILATLPLGPAWSWPIITLRIQPACLPLSPEAMQ